MIAIRYSVKRRRGFSLLEMVVASGLVAAILVPALSVMRDAMYQSRSLHKRNQLASYAVKTLEDHSASVAGNWASGIESGSFASDGHANIRYSVTKTDTMIDGGLPGQLMHIQVVVYYDADVDAVLDSGELQVNYRTKVAKLGSYEYAE